MEAALESVRLDIAELGDKSPFELSGGQQRRVAFAGVLAMEPRALVLDEPVAGLDPVAREEFLDLIAQLHGSGLTVVMVSHSMDAVSYTHLEVYKRQVEGQGEGAGQSRRSEERVGRKVHP